MAERRRRSETLCENASSPPLATPKGGMRKRERHRPMRKHALEISNYWTLGCSLDLVVFALKMVDDDVC